jgi:tetratricopeptide (TPR) repeat protein
MLPSNNECRVINQKVVNGKGATRREKIIAEAFRTLNSGGSVRVYKSLIQELKTAKDALPLPVAVRGRDVGHCAQCPTCKKYVGVVEGKFLNHSGEGNSSNERCAMSGKSVAVGNKFHAADSPRTDEDAYFKRRKEIKAKLDKKNPGDDTNKLRAHEQAMREAGKKVEPYRTANDGSGWAEEGTKRFFKGEAVRNTVGETGVVVEQNGTTVIVQPSRHTGSPENWHASKTFLLNLKKVKDNMQNEADIKSGFKMAKKADELAGKGDFSGAIRLYEQARNYLKSDPNFVAEIDEALKAARSGKAYDSFSPITLQEAQHQEVAQDHATAMDSYRQAAAGFRKIGDQRNEQIARDGIAECQRQAVRSYHGQYEHPSVGKVQAFDAAPDALRSAVERTRAGEVVRVAHDEATGEEVVEPAKDAEWKPSVWKPGTKTVILKKGSKEDKEAKRLEHNHVAQESRRTKSAKDVASDGTCDMCGAKIPKNRKGV